MKIFGRKFWRELLFALGITVVLVGAGYMYVTGGRYVATENAYVQADTVTISSNVPGRIILIEVVDNQQVEAGQLLVQLDPALYQVALDKARAGLVGVVSNIEVLRATYRQRIAELRSTEQDIVYFEREFKRQKSLLDRGMTPRATHDAAEQDLNDARAKARVARQGVSQILAAFGGSIETPTEALAMYQAALMEVRQAELNLSYTSLYAPFAGVVGQVSAVRPGDYAAAGAALFVIVDTANPWVEANFKETDLTYMLEGQAARLEVDTYPGREWAAEVSSIAPASGSEFSLLPAQNSSGNWVKVVQRIPVLLDIEPEDGGPPLRAGMSVKVTIDTEHHRVNW
ncbi:MAG: HlyD family secretion protein [Gammaproteobacteria bacterium]|nr:HlyD family secretion protein [Gammaproteobacteria bacterium]